MEHNSRKSVDRDIGDIAFSDIGELRLLVVRLDPDVALDQIDQLHTGSHQLPLLHVTLADCARGWSNDLCVPEIDIGHDNRCLFGLNVGPIDSISRVECGSLSFRRFKHGAAARQRSLRAVEVRLPACEHS